MAITAESLQPAALAAVVDDDPSVLRSVARLLKTQGIESKSYSSALALLSEIDDIRPNCIVADLSMPELSGLDLQQKLADVNRSCPMVFITGLGDVRSSVTAMQRGAVDFLEKPFEPGDFLRAVERAIQTDRTNRESRQRLAAAKDAVDSLTRRERQVFDQVVVGRLNKQIAAELGITEKTVKVHRARVMRKMGVRSIAHLARIAEQLELAEAS